MKAEGSTGTAVTGTRSIDLPTEPVKRPAHWPERVVRNRTWTSPIAPPTDEAATRRAEREAADAAVREDRAKATAQRNAAHRKADSKHTVPLPYDRPPTPQVQAAAARGRAAANRPKAGHLQPDEVEQLVDAGLARMTPAEPIASPMTAALADHVTSYTDPAAIARLTKAERAVAAKTAALEEAARARAERVKARLAALEQESDQRAAEAEAALQARIEARQARNAEARRRVSRARAEQAAKAAADRAAMADDLRRLYTAGDSLASIADTLGVSVAQVNRMRKEFGIERRRPAIDREACVRLYAEHRSLERVAELLGTVPPAVRYHLAKAGVQTRDPGDNGARTPDDVRSKAVAMYEAGIPPVQITTELGISDSTLKRIRDAAGLAANPPGKHVPPTQRDSPAEIDRRRRELLAAVRPTTSTERA